MQLWQGRDDQQGIERLHQMIKQVDDIDSLAKTAGIGLIGFACDEGVARNKGRRGAKDGPKAIRKNASNFCIQAEELPKVFDLGDITCNDEYLESSQKELATLVNKTLEKGLFPIVVGGGHETAWGHYQGISQHLKNSSLLIINFDAHLDLRPLIDNRLGSSGTPFTQIAQHHQSSQRKFNYFCVGLQELSNPKHLRQIANDLGTHQVFASDLRKKGGIKSCKQQLEEEISKVDYVYLSICLDVINQNEAPGVSSPQALGISFQELNELLSEILSSKKLLTTDIVELAPKLDESEKTSRIAATLLYNIVSARGLLLNQK